MYYTGAKAVTLFFSFLGWFEEKTKFVTHKIAQLH